MPFSRSAAVSICDACLGFPLATISVLHDLEAGPLGAKWKSMLCHLRRGVSLFPFTCHNCHSLTLRSKQPDKCRRDKLLLSAQTSLKSSSWYSVCFTHYHCGLPRVAPHHLVTNSFFLPFRKFVDHKGLTRFV